MFFSYSPVKNLKGVLVRGLATLGLGLVMAFGTLGVVSIISAQPALAASCSGASPAAGQGQLQGWKYDPPQYPGGPAAVQFLYGSQIESLPIDSNYAPNGVLPDQNWGGIDNPAPLIWYYQHEDQIILSCVFLGQGVTYSATVISNMNTNHFSPSAVGGVNPTGVAAVTPPPTVPTTPTKTGGVTTPKSTLTPPTTGSGTHPKVTIPPTTGGSGTSGKSGSGTPPPSPTISTVTPSSATNGHLVTIIGTGFGATQDAGFVRAGLNAMAVVSWSDTKIVIRPEFSPNATKGGLSPITVTNAHGQTATYQGFSLIVPKVEPPAITTVAIGVPATNPADQAVTITGTNFGSTQGQGVVTLATPTGTNLQMSVKSWSPAKIVATLHMSKEAILKQPGTYTLTLTTTQNESATSPIVIAPSRPKKVRTAASKAPGPDMRPYIVIAVAAVIVVIGWLDLRRRNKVR